MIYVIAPPAVQRGKPILRVVRGAGFFAAAIAAGIVAGAVLGTSGAGLSSTTRGTVALATALLLAAVGTVELFGHRVPLPQLSRETSRRYGSMGIGWVVRNGVAMGVGISTRLGFWLWYAVPVAAVVSGETLRGVIVFGTYALVRATAPIAIIVLRTAHWRLIALPWRGAAQRTAASLSILAAGGFILAH
jgi:hypothetical protein